MNDTTREWFTKAEADCRTAERELAVPESPNFAADCFHAQQCVEKTMKGILLDRGVVPPRTHDLVELARLVREICPGWSAPLGDLRFLVRAAAICRYPGESADHAEAEEALTIGMRPRASLRTLRGE